LHEADTHIVTTASHKLDGRFSQSASPVHFRPRNRRFDGIDSRKLSAHFQKSGSTVGAGRAQAGRITFLQRFSAMCETDNGQTTAPSFIIDQPIETGISADTLASLQNLKIGR
jgi:hypothetical protein